MSRSPRLQRAWYSTRARRRVGKAAREGRRERGRGIKQTVGHGLLDAADDHLHGERLAEGARHTENDRGEQAREGALEDNVRDGLPAGAAEGVGALAILVGHGGEGVDGKRRHRGQNHDREDDGAREDAGAGACRVTEDRTHRGVDHREADEAIDDAGDAHEELDRRLEDLAAEDRPDLDHEDRRAQGHGKREDRRENRDGERSHDEGQRAVAAIGRNPVLPRDEATEVNAVNEERGETLLGDHDDEGQNNKGHEGHAGPREPQSNVLQASLRHKLLCHVRVLWMECLG